MNNKYTTIRVERDIYLKFVDRVRRVEGSVSLTAIIMRFIERYMAETEHLVTSTALSDLPSTGGTVSASTSSAFHLSKCRSEVA